MRGCLALRDEASHRSQMLEADVARKPMIPIVDDDWAEQTWVTCYLAKTVDENNLLMCKRWVVASRDAARRGS
jgi:hypothetical protein